MRNGLFWVWLMLALRGIAAEHKFDFADFPENQTPPGFRSTVTGKGKPGDWKIVLDEVPPLLAPLTPQAPAVTRRAVLAQLAQDRTDEHFPLLVFEDEAFGDFSLTTRFKLVDGAVEQMAGVAFRIQDEKNYCYVRASALGNTFYFFKFVNGELIGPIGSKVEIAKGTWHDMTVECAGNKVTCSLDGKVVIPQLQQDTFPKGKIGFWTKSDSISYFTDAKISYTPLEVPAQAIVRELVRKYPRLLGLKVYVNSSGKQSPLVIASKDEKEIGQTGEKTEQDVISRGSIYYGKGKGAVWVIMPLRDRNGEAIAAARVVMKSFAGQTEQNALGRALPIVKEMQARIQTREDLVQ
jgi:3-keto-disaccharide hydrolase